MVVRVSPCSFDVYADDPDDRMMTILMTIYICLYVLKIDAYNRMCLVDLNIIMHIAFHRQLMTIYK